MTLFDWLLITAASFSAFGVTVLILILLEVL
jgi:hypothetical protein